MVKIATDCMAANSLTLAPNEIHDLLHQEIPADTEPKKCFIKCFAEKMQVLGADGKPNVTFLKSDKLPPCFDKTKMTDDLITKCTAVTGATACEIGVNAGKCLWDGAGNEHSSSEEM